MPLPIQKYEKYVDQAPTGGAKAVKQQDGAGYGMLLPINSFGETVVSGPIEYQQPGDLFEDPLRLLNVINQYMNL